MGAGAGVCMFVFVYYDPHNARHVHEIDEATAMPQALRLMRWRPFERLLGGRRSDAERSA
jgi:hypothetical protein